MAVCIVLHWMPRFQLNKTAQLAEQLAKYGIVTNGGGQATSSAPRQPIEGKLVSFRADLANAECLAKRLSTLGQLTFSLPCLILWVVLVLYAGTTLAQNTDKILLGLRRLTFGEPADWIALAVVYLGIKVVHELWAHFSLPDHVLAGRC